MGPEPSLPGYKLSNQLRDAQVTIDRTVLIAQISVMTEKSSDILNKLPVRLKEARRVNGLSLEAVAKLSGVSRSMVSQIERGESSPTIATLWNLTRALNVDFAGLLDTTPSSEQIEIVHPDQVPTIDNMGEGCRILILSPPEQVGQNEIYDLRLSAGGVLDSQPHKHGAREHLTVIDGDLEVTSGAETKVLSAGDTARYAADVPHRISALKGPARAFLVVQDT